MNTTTIGTCSKCGAVACEDHGPVIPMKKSDVRVDRIWSGSVSDKIEW